MVETSGADPYYWDQSGTMVVCSVCGAMVQASRQGSHTLFHRYLHGTMLMLMSETDEMKDQLEELEDGEEFG